MSTLIAVLLAVAPSPRALSDADAVTFVPKLERVRDATPFFEAAGTRSAMLRPESWRSISHPLLQFDLTDRASLTAAGVDPAGSLTLSRRAELEVSCVSLADPKVHAAACDERLGRLGTLTRKNEGGVSVVSARDPLNRVLAGYVLKGKEACAASSHGLSIEKLLPELVRLIASKPALSSGFKLAQELDGVVFFIRPEGKQTGALSVSSTGLSVTLDAKAKGLPFGPLARGGATTFSSFTPEGLLVVRAKFVKAAMPQLLDQVVRRLPGAATLTPAATALAPSLTGNVALFVHQVKVGGTLRTRAGQLFAMKFVVLAETSDSALAKSLVAALDPTSLTFKEGSLSAGVQGSLVWLANDSAAREVALAAAALPPGKALPHAVEFSADPALVARGLSQVPLLEAVQSEDLAALLAVGTEVGPLLLASDRVTGWLDAVGPDTHRAQLSWPLKASKFSPDAGQ